MVKQNQDLARQLSRYGYALFEPDMNLDPHEVLASMVRSREARFLEGFPVVLANILTGSSKDFDVRKVERRLRDPADKKMFVQLMGLSMHLFNTFSVLDVAKYPELKRFAGRYAPPHSKRDARFEAGRFQFDLERLRRTFSDYLLRNLSQAQNRERSLLREEFRTEYLLSQLLTARQKQLVMKKLYGEKMTKTEREYFSRTVKKKLKALADPDLHRMAQKALQ